MMRGHVYVLGNGAMPDLFKVGRTRNSPRSRARELSAWSGVPMDFDVLFSIETLDCVRVERDAHEILDVFRFNHSREFFGCQWFVAAEAVEIAVALLDGGADGPARRRRFYNTHEAPIRGAVAGIRVIA